MCWRVRERGSPHPDPPPQLENELNVKLLSPVSDCCCSGTQRERERREEREKNIKSTGKCHKKTRRRREGEEWVLITRVS